MEQIDAGEPIQRREIVGPRLVPRGNAAAAADPAAAAGSAGGAATRYQ